MEPATGPNDSVPHNGTVAILAEGTTRGDASAQLFLLSPHVFYYVLFPALRMFVADGRVRSGVYRGHMNP